MSLTDQGAGEVARTGKFLNIQYWKVVLRRDNNPSFKVFGLALACTQSYSEVCRLTSPKHRTFSFGSPGEMVKYLENLPGSTDKTIGGRSRGIYFRGFGH